ncbi:MAG: hypothetical protein QM775_09835 [Pirellulales bacterium]
MRAADQEFVGVLALAAEKDVAEQLKLSDEQKKKLLDLVERRESEVLDIALKLRNAPPAEREAALRAVSSRLRSGRFEVARRQTAGLARTDSFASGRRGVVGGVERRRTFETQ